MDIVRSETDGKPVKIRLRKPCDMHQHLRRAAMLQLVGPMVARRFGKAIIMPNTDPPITTVQMAHEYRTEISAVDHPSMQGFHPLMTLYLTDTLEPNEVRSGIEGKLVFGVKYYPRGLTTNSDKGVRDPSSLWNKGSKPYAVLQELAAHGAVLLLHAADGFRRGHEGDLAYELDPFEQEKHFIKETLPRIRDAHPNLKISVEHLSTEQGARYLLEHGGPTLGCSLTAHHLLLNRQDMLRGGFHPHRFWWPIIQAKKHQAALRFLAQQGHSFVWLGSDSAPHPISKKETDCCAGGVLMAHAGVEFYVEAFEDMRCLDKLEAFASLNGPKFFGVEPNSETITLVREEWKIEQSFHIFTQEAERDPGIEVIPFRLGGTVHWKLQE